MTINIIAAVSKTGQLGYQNDLLVKLPNDLKRFKRLTESNFVVMGKNTFESIGKPLPHRHNLVLTRNTNHELPNEVFVYNSISSLLHEYEYYGEKEQDIWVIGGANVYEQLLSYADNLYLTEIDHVFENADCYFPDIDYSQWELIEHIRNKADDKHLYDYKYKTYKRKA